MGVPEDLIELLCCPLCRAAVSLESERIVCSRPDCGLRYPIQDGSIPVMLIDEADRSCPGCGGAREWDGRALHCPGCGRRYEPEAEPLG